MREVVILGAGLTGLSTAYHLEKNNFFDYEIFEKENVPGGLLRSFHKDGFTFDYTGHLLHISDKYIFDFLTEICEEIDKFDLITRKSVIHSNSRETKYPFQTNLKGLPEEVIYECIHGFIKRKKSIKNPKNFYEWVMKYFGYGIGKHFLFPYNKKMQLLDLKKIMPEWTGRFVPKTNLKNILIGALSNNNNMIGYNVQFYYPKRGGIQFLINKLESKLKNKIKTCYEVDLVDPYTKTVYFKNGYQLKYKKLVTTIPLDSFLMSLNKRTNQKLYMAATKLLCNSVFNFNIGFRKNKISDNHWIYFPEKKYNFYRIGFWNNISKSTTPNGCSAIYGEVSYNKQFMSNKKISDKKMIAIKESLNFLNIKQDDIVTIKKLNIHHAYVIYDHWRKKNLHKILTQLKYFGIDSIGRYGAWKYSSMQDSILDSKSLADELLKIKSKKKNLYLIQKKNKNLQEAKIKWTN